MRILVVKMDLVESFAYQVERDLSFCHFYWRDRGESGLLCSRKSRSRCGIAECQLGLVQGMAAPLSGKGVGCLAFLSPSLSFFSPSLSFFSPSFLSFFSPSFLSFFSPSFLSFFSPS